MPSCELSSTVRLLSNSVALITTHIFTPRLLSKALKLADVRATLRATRIGGITANIQITGDQVKVQHIVGTEEWPLMQIYYKVP